MTLAKFAGEPPPPIAILKTEDSVLKGQPNIREDLSMSRTQRVYEELLRRIISGEIAQGAFLSEIKLATDFQSSRTPIREACIHLFKEGFLRVAPHKGYVVTEVSLEEIRELYELRQVLEPRAAERAAANDLGPEFRTECEELIQLTRQLSEGERTYEAFIQLGQAEYGFHRAIAKAGGNKKVAEIHGRDHEPVPPLSFRVFSNESLDQRNRGRTRENPGCDLFPSGGKGGGLDATPCHRGCRERPSTVHWRGLQWLACLASGKSIGDRQ